MEELDCKEKRKQLIRDTKTSLILDAALEVLSQKGYYETRLEDIAEKAGFSKSALYRYYKDKDEIFLTIAVRERNRVYDKLTNDPQYLLDKQLHISENLRRFLSAVFTIWGEYFSFILTLNSLQVFSLIDQLQNQNELMEIERDFLCTESKFEELIIEIFDNAKKKGEITTSLSSTLIYDFLQGLVFIKVKNWYQQKSMGNINEAIDEILSFLGKGIGF
jgi:TetR/AcrR family fatty acid metabolism transcriptional regulator